MSFSLSQKHIIVNYHYVEDPHKEFSGIHPCSVEEFERQIAFLSKRFRIGSIEDVFTAAQSKSAKRICALTFDDGLKDQYINAVPVLKKYKVSGTFFIITGTLEGVVPATHKVHTLLSQYKSDELVDRANEFLAQEHPTIKDQYYIPKDRRLSDERALRDDISTANFKETITILPKKIKNHLLDWLCESEKGMAQKLFMEKKDIQNLHTSGFWIGSHTHNHEALDTLLKNEIYNTINLSKKQLKQLSA